jgi:Rieske Fe-S protein
VPDHRCLTRRCALGATALGAGVPFLAACGGGDDAGSASPTTEPAGSSAPSGAPSGSDSVAPRDPANQLVAAEEVPVGGGVILADAQVVVTQPTEGEYKAFSAVCTHAQCTVTSIDTSILCSCHGSRYALEDGAVLAGPATSPLPAVDVAVRDGQVVRG